MIIKILNDAKYIIATIASTGFETVTPIFLSPLSIVLVNLLTSPKLPFLQKSDITLVVAGPTARADKILNRGKSEPAAI